MYDRLTESVLESPVIYRNGYPYMVHPITDGIPKVEPVLLNEVLDWLLSASYFDCDLILAPESMAIPLAVPVSIELGIPYSVMRKRSYGLAGEIAAHYRTGYSEQTLYINGVKSGDKVVIIDDIVSTGGTVRAMEDALNKAGACVTDVLIVFDKLSDDGAVRDIGGLKIKSMIRIVIRDGKVRIPD